MAPPMVRIIRSSQHLYPVSDKLTLQLPVSTTLTLISMRSSFWRYVKAKLEAQHRVARVARSHTRRARAPSPDRLEPDASA